MTSVDVVRHHDRAREVKHHGLWGPAGLGVAVLTFDVAVLRWVGLSWRDQLTFLGVLLIWALVGHLILSRWARVLPDRFTTYAASAALGMTMHAGLAFVLFHTPLQRATGLSGPRAAAFAAVAILLVPAAIEVVRAWREIDVRPWFCSAEGTARVLALASVVALLSAFGFANNEARFDFSEERHVSVKKLVESGRSPLATSVVPEWGTRQDRYEQVMVGPLDAVNLGFPGTFIQGHYRKARHYGVETLLAALSLLRGPLSLEASVAFSKPLSLLWLFLLGYWMLLIARLTAGLAEDLAVLAVAGVFFYAALNVFVLWEPITSYRIAPISGTLYHNLTQQASLALGLGGLYLALVGLRERHAAFALGCLLIAGSLPFKPSLFTLAAHSLAVATALQGHGARRRYVMTGFGLLVAAVVLWFAYPRLFHVQLLAAPLRPAFLAWHRFHVPQRIAWPVNTDLLLAVSVFALSYAGCVLPMLALASPWRSLGPRLRVAFRQPDVIALTVLFALGFLSGLFLVEDNDQWANGNLMWGYAVGHFAILPFVVLGLSRIQQPVVHHLAWALYGAHLISGGWNLLLMAYEGIF